MSQMIFARERREHPSLRDSGETTTTTTTTLFVIPDKTDTTRHRVSLSQLPRSHGRNRTWVRLKSGAWFRGVGVAAFLSTIHSVVSRHVELRNVRVAVDGEGCGVKFRGDLAS